VTPMILALCTAVRKELLMQFKIPVSY